MNLEIKKIMAEYLADLDPENAENTRESVLSSDDNLVQDCIYDTFGQKVIPVAILRKYGAKVSIRHYRFVRGLGLQRVKSLRENNIPGNDWKARGGMTEAEVTLPDGTQFYAKTRCSREDGYNKKIGAYLALEKLFESEPVGV